MPAKKIPFAMRLDAEVVHRLDALAETFREELPGLNSNRSDMVRAALLKGLDTLEREHPGKANKRAKAK